MQAIMETLFDILYLSTAIAMGWIMLRQATDKKYKLFGVMTLILGIGDAFHLVPRMIGLCTTGLEDYTVALGIGKLVTSITMTIFYVLLYRFWCLRFGKESKAMTGVIYGHAIVRIALCLLPQNQWTSADAPLMWGIIRNIPFVVLGILVFAVFVKTRSQSKTLKYMPLAIALSFAFYIPVVLFADAIPLVGMLMLPKTCMYVWMIWMGYKDMKAE
ncbi:MAG: hypothetical protein ACK5LZ_00005 [Anaerorhabdus sp.]